jgi:enoyl-CoA hydratase/carnithine racemase
MTVPVIVVDDRQDYALLTINRPDKRNAMNRQARTEMMRALAALENGPRVVVITGAGTSYCAGIDLKEMVVDRQHGVTNANQEWRDVNLAIRRHPAVMIAAVNGYALGGGVTLINVCDLALASETAELGMPEIGFATYPGLAGPSTQLSLNRKRAAWMILTGTRIDGRTAEAWGLVNQCVAAGELMTAADALARRVARFDAAALAACKRALDTIPAAITDWRQAFDYGESTNALIRETTDAQRGGMERFHAGQRNPGQG